MYLARLVGLALLLASTGPFGPLPNKPSKGPTPVIPSGAIHHPTCGSMQVQLPTLSSGVMLLTLGDSDVGDNHRLKASVELEASRGRLHLRSSIRVEGLSSYYEHNEGRIVDVNVPKGCQIASVSEDEGSVNLVRSGHSFTKAYGSGLIEHMSCRTDTNGDDVGKLRCKDIVLRSVTVELEQASTTCPYQIHMQPPDLTLAANQHTRGDDEMGGNVVNVAIDAKAKIVGDRVEVETSLSMEESVPDHTTFVGNGRTTIFDVSEDYPGCKIVSISRDEGRIRSHRRANDHHGYQMTQAAGDIVEGHLLQYASCRSDSDGRETGRVGCGSIDFNAVRIKLARK